MAYLVLAGLYFLPLFIAMHRGHVNVNAIAIANLVFGWTIIGWFGCLVWCMTAQKHEMHSK